MTDDIPGDYDTVDGIRERVDHFGNPLMAALIDGALDRIEEKPDGSGYDIAAPEGTADDSLAMIFHFGILVGAAMEREYPAHVTGTEDDQ